MSHHARTHTPLLLEEAMRVETKTAAWETTRMIDDLKRQSRGLLGNSKIETIRRFAECANLCQRTLNSNIGGTVVSDKFHKNAFLDDLFDF